MEKRKIFFDLDGTLIDSRQRLYQLFQFLTDITTVSFEEYWDLKRQKLDHSHILASLHSWPKENLDAFQKRWMGEIEKEEWLNLDRLFTTTEAILIYLKEHFDMFVVTARQSNEAAVRQLDNLGITQYFKKIFVTGHTVAKHDLIQQHITVKPQDIFVGDTGMDVETAKQLGCISVAVTSGFRNKEVLESYKPDYIFDSIEDPLFKALLLKIK